MLAVNPYRDPRQRRAYWREYAKKRREDPEYQKWFRAYYAEWREQNKGYLKKYAKDYAKLHKKEIELYRQANKDWFAVLNRLRYQEQKKDPVYRKKLSERSRTRQRGMSRAEKQKLIDEGRKRKAFNRELAQRSYEPFTAQEDRLILTKKYKGQFLRDKDIAILLSRTVASIVVRRQKLKN